MKYWPVLKVSKMFPSAAVSRRPQFLAFGPPKGLLQCPCNVAAGSPQREWSKKAKQRPQCLFFNLCAVLVLITSVVSGSLRSYGPESARLLCPWNSPGKNTGVGSLSLLQGSSWPRDQSWVSHFVGRFFTVWANWGAIILGTTKSITNRGGVPLYHVIWEHLGNYIN